MKWHRNLLFLFIVIIWQSFQIKAQSDENDLLVYSIYDYGEGSSVILYNPATGEKTTLYESKNRIYFFFFSPDGRIVFNLSGDPKMLLLDIRTPNETPVNLSQILDLPGYPLGWGPDGRYLAFSSPKENQGDSIYLWDSETDLTINITPKSLAIPIWRYNIAWSRDGRLAFTAWYEFGPYDEANPEIYVWDGNNTVNLSQNPRGEDRFPVWNSKGELAFLSTRTGAYEILVWDGISYRNNVPDSETFINISPELTYYHSHPIWASDETIAFTGYGDQDRNAQIYLWDGENTTNISQNPNLHNGTPTWSSDGLWAFATFFSSDQLLYIRDHGNHTVFKTMGIYTPAWSFDGNLVFCSFRNSGLYLWNGQEAIEVELGWEIEAQWQGGEGVHCTSG